ncbi:Histone H2A.Z-specific chaperone CHZ1 [Leucoagaricus gongylophorus]
MSTSFTDPTSDATSAVDNVTAASPNKGKGKAPATDDPIDGDEEDDQDEDDEGDEDEEDEDEEESYDDIDPSAILQEGGRTRGLRVDYTSLEAMEKAGLTPGDADDDEDDDIAMN